MKPKDTTYAFEIPKLGKGTNKFDFSVGDDFFQRVEEPLVSGGRVNVTLGVEKNARLMVMNYRFSGVLRLECDRCLQPFDMKVDFSRRVVYSFEPYPVGLEEEDVYEISPNQVWFDASTDIYDFLSLAVPMRKVPDDCPGESCPPEIFRYLKEPEIPKSELSEVWDFDSTLN
jgi:uncharacterized metal-binding protein YceD (DUF177 family)